jgi:alkanesulfonate monooxygenase SsuD/methylene tetrahydromethanopterin reductase-like flavin-dependent oxidoreductase (luciferase family)
MLARTRETEALGFDGLFLVDHFFGLKDVRDPTHEAYTMLAALAPFTQAMRLGIMVSGNSYRTPALLLKQAITVDHISGGRVDFGVGAGWLEREHEAYGFAFPSARERVDRFEEALHIWNALQEQDWTTHDGEHYRLLDAPFEPKSLQGRLPLLIGGSKPRMLRLVARHADIWNTVGTPDAAGALNRKLDGLCAEEGRDPSSLVRTVSPAINLLESAEAFIDGVAAYHRAGFRDIYLPWPRTGGELPVLRQVAAEIMPSLRSGTAIGRPRQDPDPIPMRAIRGEDLPLVGRILAGVQDQSPWRFLAWLTTHPDRRFEGVDLREPLGVETHAEVTLAAATLADAFASHGLARPWNEAQRGYLITSDMAGIIARAHENG